MIDFSFQGLLAIYGAVVGTVALLLNYLRYRHAVLGQRIRLKIEIEEVMSEEEFRRRLADKEAAKYGNAHETHITHKIKVRNLGAVQAHISDAWIVTTAGEKKAATTRRGDGHSIFLPVSAIGNQKVEPRANLSLSVFSKATTGYLTPTRAVVLDATGKQWRSRKHK